MFFPDSCVRLQTLPEVIQSLESLRQLEQLDLSHWCASLRP